MALDPSTKYPGQILTSDPVGYPYGRPRNESGTGARNGTPLEEAWVSDLWGFLQAILLQAGITPSGTADKVGASQYLEALEYIATHTDFTSAITQLGSGAANELEGTLQVGGSIGVTLGDLTLSSGEVVASGATVGYVAGLTAIPSFDSPVSVVRFQALTPLFNGTTSQLGTVAGWNWNVGNMRWEGGGDDVYLPLSNLVDNSTLTAVTIRVSGSSAGATAYLYTDDNGTGRTLLETQADSGGPGVRDLTITVSPAVTIAMSTAPRSLYVAIEGCAAGYCLHRMTATFAATKVNP
jgi:hypothetical protein